MCACPRTESRIVHRSFIAHQVGGVPFVPAWMAAVAAEVGAAMREWEAGLAVQSDGTPPSLPFALLRLRGSLRTRQSVAVLTPTRLGSGGDGDSEGGGGVGGGGGDSPGLSPATTAATAALAARMARAAAAHGQRLSVLVRSAGGLLLVDAAGSGGGEGEAGLRGHDGSITEEMGSGLRLSIAPLAFFQTCTAAADLLLETALRMNE